MARLAFLILVALSSPAAAQSVPAQPLDIGETFLLQSKALGEARRINVYLPASYVDSSSKRFPVLYMPDGGLAEDFLHVAGLVQVSAGNGTMRSMVLVGIENTQRRRDLTGPTEVAKDRGLAPNSGGSATFRAFIRTELMPEVDRRYRTTSERSIIGESLAGLFIVETFFLEPALFNTYIAIDPSLWWNGEELVKRAADRLRNGVGQGKALYVASSSERLIAPVTAKLAAILEKDAPAGLEWSYDPMPGETHGTIFHPAALRAVRRLFKPD
jgi:predicted alpha/beta superfamily hydrolase